MISRALLNAPFFIPKDADLLRNRKVNTKKRQNRHLPELAFLILGTYFTAPFFAKKYFGEINFMTRSHTDKEQLSSMFAFLHTYLKYSGKLNMLDENKAMEDIMCEVLNRVYGWHVRGT